MAKVTLRCGVFEDATAEERVPFKLTVEMVGLFTILEPTAPNLREVVATDSLAILFPYLRSVVTAVTSAANVSPLVLPTMNMAKPLGRAAAGSLEKDSRKETDGRLAEHIAESPPSGEPKTRE